MSYVSDDYPVFSGVPQGSHLGPLLFLIFINDLPLVLDCSINILLFADDAKIFCTVNSLSDAEYLQYNLNTFHLWSKLNLLPLNIDKCHTITFTRKKNPIFFNYNIEMCSLTRVNVIKDLGIYFESDLSFKTNHNMIINKSFKMLGFINRNTKDFKNPLCLKTLYTSLVRSNLDFGSVIWSCKYLTYINDLDNVQYKFLKRISYLSNIPLSRDSLHLTQDYIGLVSLSLRRKLTDIMFVYDLINYNIVCPELLSEISFRIPYLITRNSHLFLVPHYKTNSGTNSIFPRALILANKICIHSDIFFLSRNCFKSKSMLLLKNID